MTTFKDRTGDFTKKKHVYKFYKNGYTSRKPKYITKGQFMDFTTQLLSGSVGGNASISGSFYEDGMSIFGSGDSNLGISATYMVKTDERRKIDLKGVIAKFSHGGAASGMGSLNYYEIKLFDYTIKFTSSSNTLKVFYKTTELASVTMATGYAYIRMRESGGTLYIDRSADGATWTNWTSRVIDFATDTTQSSMSLTASGGAGGIGTFSANVANIDVSDRNNQLLAVEANALSELEFDESINNPASSTTVTLPYNPLNVPEHCDMGNFVEIYTNFYDDGAIKVEPILDENSNPILDENSNPILGLTLDGSVPEKASILKFSGYVDGIDYDYDNETIELTLISHGEIMANSIVRNGKISAKVIDQPDANATMSATNRRQTFTLNKMTKVDAVRIYVAGYTGGGSSQLMIGKGKNTVIASSEVKSWSGAISAQGLQYDFAPLYLDAGQYWIQDNGQMNWNYFNSDKLAGGSLQMLYDGVYGNIPGDLCFSILSTQQQLAATLEGDSKTITYEIFRKSLDLDYSQIYIEEVGLAGYDISIGLNIDSAKNAIDALYRQLPSGWFYHVDVGTGAFRIKDKSSTPDHLLVFGRDFTEMKLRKDIEGIINDVYYIGKEVIENGPKMTVQATDTESIFDYRRGLSIISNDKVTRYDTAQLLADNAIANNNQPRLTTEITISAAKYNTETIRAGDVVKIVNGDQDVLGATLVVATVKHAFDYVTVSLDSAPRNLSRTIDAIQRTLQNQATANATDVI